MVWAIIALFGHHKVAGSISEVEQYGSTFCRVNVPETSHSEAFTRDFGGGAIYSISYVTEEIARAAAEELRISPVTVFGVSRRLLPKPQEIEQLESGDDE